VVEHRGEFFDFEPLSMSPAPARPLPVWVGGISKPALRRAARLGDGWIGTGQTPEQASEILAELARLRAAAGRAAQPFETIVPLVVPPERDLLRRLADQGASGTVSYPFTYTVGPTSTLAQKRAYLEGFAENVIARQAA
jgi:alkanesulfonate monooxygenase SsuD/methylene tetrahydromethanopterin reductase-like flavin-dependent oxidoreductase (luciferase family)